MAIFGVAHVAISTPDLDRACAFWSAVGFVETRRWAWDRVPAVDRLTGLTDSAARAVLLEGFGTSLELFEFSAPAQTGSLGAERPVSDHGITHLCLAVDDLDADCERLAAVGMRFWTEAVTDPKGRRLVYGRDPDGNVVELVQRAG